MSELEDSGSGTAADDVGHSAAGGTSDSEGDAEEMRGKREYYTMSGSRLYYARMVGKKKGPETLELFANYPRTIMQNIFGGQSNEARLRQIRTMAFLEKGLVAHHDWCGRQSWEIGLKLMGIDLKELGLPPDWLVVFRCSESSRVVRELYEGGTARPQHSFPSIEAVHLRPQDFKFLKSIKPRKDAFGKDKHASNEAMKVCCRKWQENKCPCDGFGALWVVLGHVAWFWGAFVTYRFVVAPNLVLAGFSTSYT
jgi:hypothetical protein